MFRVEIGRRYVFLTGHHFVMMLHNRRLNHKRVPGRDVLNRGRGEMLKMLKMLKLSAMYRFSFEQGVDATFYNKGNGFEC